MNRHDINAQQQTDVQVNAKPTALPIPRFSVVSQIKALVLREYDLTRRYLLWDIVFLVYGAVNAISIGLIGSSLKLNGIDTATVAYQTKYLVIGALMWAYLAVLFRLIANSIAYERWEGTLEYTFMAPVKRSTHLAGIIIVAVLYSLVRAIIILLMLVPFFRFDFTGANMFGALIILAVSSFPLAGLGMAAATMPLLSPEKGPQATHIILGTVLLFSGVYYPISYLPEWLRWAAYITPITYTLDGVRACILDGVSTSSQLGLVGGLILSGVVLIPIGFYVFVHCEHYAKRIGRLKRSG